MDNPENKPAKKVWKTPQVILIDVDILVPAKTKAQAHENTGTQYSNFFVTLPNRSHGFPGTKLSAIS